MYSQFKMHGQKNIKELLIFPINTLVLNQGTDCSLWQI